MTKLLQQHIIQLLQKSHKPRVIVSKSTIPNAGSGVFSTQHVSHNNDTPTVLCLYPGIYTPPLPIYAMGRAEYLANLSPPSSKHSDIKDNGYIMNLNSVGGYIDGCALTSQYDTTDDSLDINPSTVGHLVNHDSTESNVGVISFAWDDILSDGRQDTSITRRTNEDYFAIPNELRADCSPWYFDTVLDEIVYFRTPDEETLSLPYKLLCGAALVSSAPICKGEELLLDYGLKKDEGEYPAWAKEWY